MIGARKLLGMKRSKKIIGCKIEHLSRGTTYTVIGTIQSKLLDGSWADGLIYIGKDRILYVRPIQLFDGFVFVKDNQPLWAKFLVWVKILS